MLGLRLVKKTVNQDDPTVYHLFYADEEGSPGSDITFFEYPGVARGRAGDGMIHTVRWRVGSEDALDFWAERLGEASPSPATTGARVRGSRGSPPRARRRRDGRRPLIAKHPEIPPELALQGFDGVRAYASDPERSRSLLEEALGFVPAGDGTWEARGETRGGLYSYDAAARERGLPGAGTVHHVAWASTMEEHEGWRERVAAAGARRLRSSTASGSARSTSASRAASSSRSRRSGPGFAVDEDPEHLGESLVLPPAFEHLREQIEPVLTPLPDPARRIRGDSRRARAPCAPWSCAARDPCRAAISARLHEERAAPHGALRARSRAMPSRGRRRDPASSRARPRVSRTALSTFSIVAIDSVSGDERDPMAAPRATGPPRSSGISVSR